MRGELARTSAATLRTEKSLAIKIRYFQKPALKLVIENILTKEINLPIFNSAREKRDGLVKTLKEKLKSVRKVKINESKNTN